MGPSYPPTYQRFSPSRPFTTENEAMKLHSISCFSVDIPAAGGSYVMSHGRKLSAFPATIVKVTTNNGTTGWGEAGTLGGKYLNGFPGSARETVKGSHRSCSPAIQWTPACSPTAWTPC